MNCSNHQPKLIFYINQRANHKLMEAFQQLCELTEAEWQQTLTAAEEHNEVIHQCLVKVQDDIGNMLSDAFSDLQLSDEELETFPNWLASTKQVWTFVNRPGLRDKIFASWRDSQATN